MNTLTPPLPESLRQQALIARGLVDTPLGVMTTLVTSQGLAALLFEGDKYHTDSYDAVPLEEQQGHVKAAREWLTAYWAGQWPDPRALPLDLAGTAFQRAVWSVLLGIPQGRTWSYGQVAQQVGPGTAPRATGTAIGRNPVAVLVPCHRVIGANGSLTGYAGGLPRKERLLQHEGVLLT